MATPNVVIDPHPGTAISIPVQTPERAARMAAVGVVAVPLREFTREHCFDAGGRMKWSLYEKLDPEFRAALDATVGPAPTFEEYERVKAALPRDEEGFRIHRRGPLAAGGRVDDDAGSGAVGVNQIHPDGLAGGEPLDQHWAAGPGGIDEGLR